MLIQPSSHRRDYYREAPSKKKAVYDFMKHKLRACNNYWFTCLPELEIWQMQHCNCLRQEPRWNIHQAKNLAARHFNLSFMTPTHLHPSLMSACHNETVSLVGQPEKYACQVTTRSYHEASSKSPVKCFNHWYHCNQCLSSSMTEVLETMASRTKKPQL